MSNNSITCQKLFIDTFNLQVVIDVSAKLIQKDENLLIETSIEPREFNFQKLSILLKMSLILCIGSLVFAFVIFLALSITTSNPQIFLFLLVSLIGGFMLGLALLNNAKEKALETAREELKKEYELAFLRTKSS